MARRAGNHDWRLPAAALTACAFLLAPLALPKAVQTGWRYDRTALAAGEWWRWLSAHFVHLDARHALLNAGAAAVLVMLLGHSLSPRHWLWVLACAVVAVDAGLWFLAPQIAWYVGASGVLHGVIAGGGLALARSSDWRGGALLVLVAGKIVFEQLTTSGIGFAGDLPVVVDAHLYGALGGGIGYFVGSLFDRSSQS